MARKVLTIVVALLVAALSAVVAVSRLDSAALPEAEAIPAEEETAREAPARAAVPRARNVVFLMVDDMRADDLRYMPWTQRLIRDQGVQFTNSFSPFPLCCPARASVLTGRYTHNHRVFGVHRPFGFTSFDDRSTLATWLRDAGFFTSYLGKYLNEYGEAPPHGRTSGNSVRYVPPGWTKWRASIDGGLPQDDPRAGGTYFFMDTTLSVDGKSFANYAGQYQTYVYGRLSEEILRRRAAATKPFFFYASYTAPHSGWPYEPDDPLTVPRDGSGTAFYTTARPPEVRGMFDDVIRSAPGASWSDPDFSDKPEYLRSRPVLSAAERDALLEMTRQRAEALAVVDQQVRRTVRVLRQTGVLDETLVVFTSDNGFFLGEQRMRQGKIFPHEPSVRVPLLMRGPGIPAGGVRRDPFTSVDFAPTLLAATGVPRPHPFDGRSMWEVAVTGDQGWRGAILNESGPMRGVVRDTDEAGGPLGPDERRDKRFVLGVRTERYLYVDLATGEEELYDLQTDPQQYVNLVGAPAYAARLSLLRDVLSQLRTCRGAGCRVAVPAELSGAAP